MEEQTKPMDLGPLFKALAAAQGELKPLSKDKDNPFFKSKYADLASLREAVLPVFSKHGLSVIQFPNTDSADVASLVTYLCHESGGFIKESQVMKPVKADPQGLGSCITYMCRYALQGLSGIPVGDDDGNEASGKTAAPKATSIPQSPYKKPYPPKVSR